MKHYNIYSIAGYAVFSVTTVLALYTSCTVAQNPIIRYSDSSKSSILKQGDNLYTVINGYTSNNYVEISADIPGVAGCGNILSGFTKDTDRYWALTLKGTAESPVTISGRASEGDGNPLFAVFPSPKIIFNNVTLSNWGNSTVLGGLINSKHSSTWRSDAQVTLNNVTVENCKGSRGIMYSNYEGATGGISLFGDGDYTFQNNTAPKGVLCADTKIAKVFLQGSPSGGFTATFSNNSNYDVYANNAIEISGNGRYIFGSGLYAGGTGTNLRISNEANVTLGAGSISTLSSGITLENSAKLTLMMGSKVNFTNNKTYSGPVSIASGAELIFTGGTSFQSNASFTYSGSGTVTVDNASIVLSGENTGFNGKILLKNNSLCVLPSTNTMKNASFELDNSTIRNWTVNSECTYGNNFTFLSSATFSTKTNGTSNFTGIISGTDSATVKILDLGTAVFKSQNTYLGPTYVDTNATLRLDIADSILSSSKVSLASGATIRSAVAQTLKHLSGEGSVSMAGQTLTLYNDEGEDNATTFSGNITAEQLIKNGGGTLRLNQEQNAATLTADVLVQAGRLDLKGNLTGDLTVMNGAIFSPGNSIGEASVVDAIFEEGSVLLIEMDETGNDLLTFNSAEFNGGQISLFDLGGATVPDRSFVFLNADSGLPTDLNSLLTPESRALWNLSLDAGGGIRATIDNNAIPEPASWMLLLFGSLGMLSLYRKRK